MTQEEKLLLLKDLCARVPYHPKGLVVNARTGAKCEEWLTCATFPMFTNIINNCRLYLRPMSSMTEEECDKVEEILGNDCIFDFMGNGDIVLHKGHFTQKTLSKLYDFYNSIHLDYHTDDEGKTMIEKGLAIEVNKSNNPYKD